MTYLITKCVIDRDNSSPWVHGKGYGGPGRLQAVRHRLVPRGRPVRLRDQGPHRVRGARIPMPLDLQQILEVELLR